MTEIAIRELKAKTGKLLREVSERRKEFIITSHGRPCGKLVPVDEDVQLGKKSPKTLRGAYSDLPEVDENQFQELKKTWEKSR